MGKGKKRRHQPLAVELDEDLQEQRELELRRKRMLRRRTEGQGDDDGREDDEEGATEAPGGGRGGRGGAGEGFLDPKTSRNILQQASTQLAEEEQERRSSQRKAAGAGGAAGARVTFNLGGAKGAQQRRAQSDSDDSDEGSDLEEGPDLGAWDEEDEEDEEDAGDYDEEDLNLVEFKDGAVHSVTQGLSEAEQKVVASFMDVGAGERRTLADIIMDKIREKEEAEAGGYQEEEEPQTSITPKVREVYTEIGKMLRTYTSGKLPKAFKILPALANWEEVVYLTRPDEWTPHATYAATRIFASNLNAKLSQRFFNLILLEKCRDDIHNNKNLNYHYYMALKKAMYKPGAFFKGILLPLIQSGDCTIREATIIGSVLAKVSIPVNHAAVVLLKLATARDYAAPCSIFLKVLLNKKYTLPYRVIDALVDYFVRFASAGGGSGGATSSSMDYGGYPASAAGAAAATATLPVLWHQSLLVFAQRYKEEVTRADKERLREVLKAHQHHQITPEVRRELFNCRCRGEIDPAAALGAGSMQLG